MYKRQEFHLDGLRVDAVASMLYLDFGRTEWHPNREGGNLNLEAIEFLKRTNRAVAAIRSNVIMAAEESSTFPKLTEPVEQGGLGFTMKWCMGWMNDMLRYMALDPIDVYKRQASTSVQAASAWLEEKWAAKASRAARRSGSVPLWIQRAASAAVSSGLRSGRPKPSAARSSAVSPPMELSSGSPWRR